MTYTRQPGTTYRLDWSEPCTTSATASGDDATEAWIGSDDPAAIVRYVAGRGWDPQTALKLSVMDTAQPSARIASVLCSPADVLVWSHDEDQLPHASPSLSRPRSRSAILLAFMRDVSAAVRNAAAAELISTDDADGLMLLIRDVVERHRDALVRHRTAA